jgi:DNA-binding NarL/FixJ family response regulator
MSSERFSLLIVEDDEDLRFLIRTYVRNDQRLQVGGEFPSAEEALEAARSAPPDLIVLDHVLEGELTGIDAAALFKEVAPDTKVLIFTASAHPSQATDVPAIDVFLQKTEIGRLLRTIQALLGLEAP